MFIVMLASLYYSFQLTRAAIPYHRSIPTESLTSKDHPPEFTGLREWERNLPQHNLDLPFPEGEGGRFVFFANSKAHPVGWNNKLNDMLMNTWLAHESNRAYVFHDFVWTKSHYPRPSSAYRDWVPRTPLNAFISGPSAGGPWEVGDNAPRSVSEDWFNIVCPKSERRYINTRDLKPPLRSADGKVVFETWQKLLTDAPEKCVEIVPAGEDEDPFPETFDIWLWSGERSVSLWDAFKVSPVSRLLGTSRLVESAIERNRRLFFTAGHPPSIDPFDNVLSIHVRRGDFKEACLEHAAENSTFYNWNLLPFLPDKFYPPPARVDTVPDKSKILSENEKLYLARCLPSAVSIVQKVRAARKEYLNNPSFSAPDSFVNVDSRHSKRLLDVLYIMSNDGTEWLDDLKELLRKDGWGRIVTGRDLKLNAEQKDVGVAVDMDIGRRSAVFIGNGWSSFTSNVVHRRLVDGKAPISIRFW